MQSYKKHIDYRASLEDENLSADLKIKGLFSAFQKIVEILEEYDNRVIDSPEDTAYSEQLLDKQSEIMRLAAALEAKTVEEAFLKLVMWRLDAPEINGPIASLSRYDAVAVSAYNDFKRLLSVKAPDLHEDADGVN